jgi:hypothetical protein
LTDGVSRRDIIDARDHFAGRDVLALVHENFRNSTGNLRSHRQIAARRWLEMTA